MGYDVVIAGGGSAGCVLAARLSADPARRVLLLEAGPDHATLADLPPDVADATEPTFGHDWGYAAEADGGRVVGLPRGKLVGGCSSTNAAFLMRGWPQDFDAWAAAGNPGWAYEDLLPLVRALESDHDVDDAWHGTEGPLPVTRAAPQNLTPAQRAFGDAAVAAGHSPVFDHNRPGSVGVGVAPRNVLDGVRMSTALTHLAPARGRPNLTVRPNALVDRVEVTGGRARGVRLAGGELVLADRVVLALGSYGSPAALLRSGIGPAADLTHHQVSVLVDLPGVGSNLIDHPLVSVDLPVAGGSDGAKYQVLLTMRSSRAAADDPPDLHLFAAGPFDNPGVPSGGVFAIVCGLMSVRSRGSVRLRSADPVAAPVIDPAHLRDPDDLARMVEATVAARRIARTQPLAALVAGDEIAPGAGIADHDARALAASICARVGTYHHPVGTCAMGPDPARGAVVDPRGAVHGVEGLWVADASVMPTIPCANTLHSTVLVAERIGTWLAE